MKKLEQDFYLQDTLTVAKNLIGKYLVHVYNDETLVCLITETEGYTGVLDKACHAFGNRKTSRTEAMYLPGGHAYVYLIYGMHNCLNVVCEAKDIPCAVLIRGAYPISGNDYIANLRFQKPYGQLNKAQRQNLLNGPGKLAAGMAVTANENKLSLLSDYFFIMENPQDTPPEIGISARININHAEEYTKKPWRFFHKQYVKK